MYKCLFIVLVLALFGRIGVECSASLHVSTKFLY